MIEEKPKRTGTLTERLKQECRAIFKQMGIEGNYDPIIDRVVEQRPYATYLIEFFRGLPDDPNKQREADKISDFVNFIIIERFPGVMKNVNGKSRSHFNDYDDFGGYDMFGMGGMGRMGGMGGMGGMRGMRGMGYPPQRPPKR